MDEEREVSDLELERAAVNGDLDVLDSVSVQRLRQFKHSNGFGWELVLVAVLHGQADVVTYLVQRSVESGVDVANGYTMGHAAAFAGDLEAVGALSEEELRLTTPRRETLLHAAAGGGHVDMVERLLQLGLDPKAAADEGWTIMHAAAQGGHVAVIDMLVELGVDPKATEDSGWTIMHEAAQYGRIQVIDRLVELGVDPKVATKDGWTTIHAAARLGHVAAIGRLVELGVDPSVMTDFGTTALQLAVNSNHGDAAALLGALIRGEAGWSLRATGESLIRFISGEEPPSPGLASTLVELHSQGPMPCSRLEQVLALWPELQLLEVLDVRGLDVDGLQLVPLLGDLPALRRLRLVCDIPQLPAAPHALDESDGEAVTSSLAGIERCVGLASLTLTSCSLSSHDLDAIAALPRLVRLTLSGVRVTTFAPLGAGCLELRYLDVRHCNISKPPLFLASLPSLKQLLATQNPFAAQLQEYAELLADPAAAVDFLRALSLSSESKSHDVPVVTVGHGRAGKSQLIRALVQERSWRRVVPGAVEHVPEVTERTAMVESGIRTLRLSAHRAGTWWDADEFEARFFDTPGQMEFFASNMVVISPLLSSSVVVVVVRCVSHGVSRTRLSVVEEKQRVEREFRLWLAEVSRAVQNAEATNRAISAARRTDNADHAERLLEVPQVSKRADVLLVLTHRDVLKEAKGKRTVDQLETWLGSLATQLRAEFSSTLEVHGSIDFVNATVAGTSGHGVASLRQQLRAAAHSTFVNRPSLPDVLVEARAFVLSDEVQQERIFTREGLEELVASRFSKRGLTPRLLQRLLEVLEANGSVLRTPGRRLVVVDPAWISHVMSSLYVNPRLHDLEHEMGVDASAFDALASLDEAGEVLAPELDKHLRQFVNSDDALERLKLVLASSGITIPLRVSEGANKVPQIESYLIVGRWMTSDCAEGGVGVTWKSARGNDASWFDLVTGNPYSVETAAQVFLLGPRLRAAATFRLVSLRCTTRVPTGPSFLTWLVYELSTQCKSAKHSFTVRRNGFACVLPFTRFHAAVHVQLPVSGREFDLTLVAAAGDASEALSFMLLDVVFPVLEKLSLQVGGERLHVVQRCGGCVATSENLQSDPAHNHVLASGGEVTATAESVRALCSEMLVDDSINYCAEQCRGRDGALNAVQPAGNGGPRPPTSAASFVPDIPPALIKLGEEVAAGQFGSVMKGTYNGAGVVLKQLKVSSREALVAFELEAQLLGRASRHPCVAQLLGLCRMGEEQVYMVMESAGVCDLEKALCKQVEKPLLGKHWSEFGVLVSLLKDVADGLRHMHSQDPVIVHNDVALRNVLVRHENGRNRAKLADLGLARTVQRGHVRRLAPGTRVPKWQLAPETLESGVVSPASDVFQFGNLVFEALTRQRPFHLEWRDRASRASVVEDIKGGKRVSWKTVKKVGAFCSTWLRELAKECLRDDPQTRPTIASVSERLQQHMKKMLGVPREQEPLGLHAVKVQPSGYVHGDNGDQGHEDASLPEPPAADVQTEEEEEVTQISSDPTAGSCQEEEEDDGDDEDEAKQPDSDSAETQPAVVPSSVSHWSADDVCSWLLQLSIPSCVELVPLFRKHSVDGELLLTLDADDLVELGILRITIKALFKARSKLLP